ncbi:unnamed protein product [Soboliphyme baturini]|uniref:Palmitoyltransferase n=1 Tax=Soboliphyme baturini TaxID=241478 RepID=A0A183IKB6_9BILA|nr:unnamed protein product [Soboliphyme baturini]
MKSYIRLRLSETKALFWSMFYNDHCDLNYAIDTLFEPMFWFVDNYVSFLGKAFTLFLFCMVVIVILIGYFIVAPYEWQRRPTIEIVAYLVIGHWLLINFLFNYYMAYVVKPGFVMKGRFIDNAVSMCKHCISPKPPRTHHCSICNRCILKMDHHCRCLYILVGMRYTFVDHYWLESAGNQSSAFGAKTVRYCILVDYLTVCGMVLGLLALICWHAHLISHGETSIERHINGTMRTKYKNYVNPYNFGVSRNWKKFLAINNFHKNLLFNVLLPSIYKAEGNGIYWETVDNVNAWLHDSNYGDKNR